MKHALSLIASLFIAATAHAQCSNGLGVGVGATGHPVTIGQNEVFFVYTEAFTSGPVEDCNTVDVFAEIMFPDGSSVFVQQAGAANGYEEFSASSTVMITEDMLTDDLTVEVHVAAWLNGEYIGTQIRGLAARPEVPDLNGDGQVGIFDVVELLSRWGVASKNDEGISTELADLNADGKVNVHDLLILLANFT